MKNIKFIKIDHTGEIKPFSFPLTMGSSAQQETEMNLSGVDVNRLLYVFDSSNPWQYFRQGKPLASSVEKGRRTLTSRSKLKRVYVPKAIRVNRRKNAAFELHDLNLTCCDNGCLLRHGLRDIKRIIRRQRNLLYDKQYNEQNYFLSKLLEVKITPTGKRKITYRAPLLGEVCKTAFLKVYGISKHKIECLLKKMNFEGPLIEPDRRGQTSPRRLLPETKNTVIDFILSYEATESHYRRSRNGSKKYFDAHESMRKMWSEYIRKHPDVKTTKLKRKNKGPVISFSTFRNIFNTELKDVLSFRKSRVDTCQVCDKTNTRLKYLKSLRNRSDNQNQEICELTDLKNSHLRESEARFASLKYDVTVLASKVQ